MKTIGTIILLTIFLMGAYLLGNYKETAPLKKRIDSLQATVHNQVVEIKRLKVSLDSSKKSITAICAGVSSSTMQKPKKK